MSCCNVVNSQLAICNGVAQKNVFNIEVHRTIYRRVKLMEQKHITFIELILFVI